jgi:hypothetical protein
MSWFMWAFGLFVVVLVLATFYKVYKLLNRNDGGGAVG